MGKSSKTNSTTSSQTSLTQTPTNPDWVTNGLGGIGNQVNDLSHADPYSFIAPTNPVLTQAGALAGQLTGQPGDYAGALDVARGVANSKAPDLAALMANFQSPYTNQVVNTTLASLDQNAGRTRAQDLLGQANDTTFGGSGGAVQMSMDNQNSAQLRAQTEAALRDQGFQTALGGATSQGNLNSQNLSQRLAAAGLIDQTANDQQATQRANIGTQADIGSILQQLAQQKAASPLGLLATQAGLYGSLPLNLLHGQTANGTENGTSNSTTTVNDPIGQIASLMQGAGSVATGLAMFSDRRLKRDIRKVAERPDGLGVYLYRYLWSPVVHLGVMAQEVLRVKPEAVLLTPSGYLAVDYGKL